MSYCVYTFLGKLRIKRNNQHLGSYMPETKFNKSSQSYPTLIYKNAVSLSNVVMRIFLKGV